MQTACLPLQTVGMINGKPAKNHIKALCILEWGLILSVSVKCDTQLNLPVVQTLKELVFKRNINIARNPSSVLNYSHGSL